MTTTPVRGRIGLDEHGVKPVGVAHWNPTTAQLYEHALAGARDGSPTAGPSSARHRQAHRPLAQGQVRRARAVVRGPHLVGQREPAGRGADLRRLREKVTAHLGEARPLRHRRVRRRRSRAPHRGPRRHHAPVPRAVRADDVHHPTEHELAAFEPEAVVLHAPGFEADPEEDGTRPGTFIVLHPTPAGDADRRHVLRRRDQEVDLHADERPAAARGRLPDALLGERRRGRATSRSSSGSPAPARRRSPPTRSGS